jgi:hypothetical protein
MISSYVCFFILKIFIKKIKFVFIFFFKLIFVLVLLDYFNVK